MKLVTARSITEKYSETRIVSHNQLFNLDLDPIDPKINPNVCFDVRYPLRSLIPIHERKSNHKHFQPNIGFG